MKQFVFNEETEIEKEYVSRTAKSKTFDQTACQYLPGGSTRSATDSHPYPIYMSSGKGCFLVDVDGNEYIDFMNNYTVLILGHVHPKVTQAVSEQIQEGILLGAPSQSQYELAQLICERIGSVDRIRFCNTGTEGVMYALRAARAVTGRTKVVKMEGGFHGNTEQTEISVSPDLALAGPAESPIPIPETPGVPQGVLQDILVAPFNNIEATKKIIHNNRKEVAAVIVEPVMGASGMIPAKKEFLKFLREITTQNNIMLIFDEIITFRLSPGGYQAICDVRPDFTTFGKIIGGGFPIGAFGGREDIMDLFSPKRKNPMHHSGTFNGNAVTMAAGIAAMKEIDDSLISNINKLGDKLRKGIQDLFNKKGIRGQVTGMGSLMNIHFSTRSVVDLRSAKANWNSSVPIRDLLSLALRNNGIYTPQRVMLCISSPMTDKEIHQTLQAFEESLGMLKPVMERNCPELLI
ncbi:MAG: aspartate aminotransferase family protein [Deltaproteobacteria bacterium]|nr:aspartate aminotransferase family protein [Deltaproteobacteria bacterium]